MGYPNLSANSKKGQELLNNYNGFCFTEEEVTKFNTLFECDIQMYVQIKDNIYGIGTHYENKDAKKTLHLQLKWSTKKYTHVAFVAEIDKITHCKVCPKCHFFQKDTSDRRDAMKFRDHVELCKGKTVEPGLKLKDSVPYCPLYNNNKEYALLFSQ
jgi:hypothetical protein